jgi:comEA protein
LKETIKAKRRSLLHVARRVLVVAGFAVAGICYLSGGEPEDVYPAKSTGRMSESGPEGTGNAGLKFEDVREGTENAGAVSESVPESLDTYGSERPNDVGTGQEKEEALTTENIKININTAGEEELTALNGIGPAKAKKIIEFRNKNGGFKSIEELMLVPGIKEGTFSKIKEDISV